MWHFVSLCGHFASFCGHIASLFVLFLFTVIFHLFVWILCLSGMTCTHLSPFVLILSLVVVIFHVFAASVSGVRVFVDNQCT